MVTRTDLLLRGFLPESLPPIFSSKGFSEFSAKFPAAILVPREDVRGTDYSASQTGYRRRGYTLPHPISQFHVADFIEKRWPEITAFTDQSTYSLSKPRPAPAASLRSVEIASFNELHSTLHKRLGHFPFVAKSDVRRYFPSIYTHSISWAFHGKKEAKADRKANSQLIFFNRLDLNIRRGQDGQTIGLPIGPDTSRIVSEIIGKAIDDRIRTYAGGNLGDCVRHMDDIYMGATSRQAAEHCIAALRKALRDFELEINETKTKVYESASFLEESWPREIQKLVELRPFHAIEEAKIFEMFEGAFSIARREDSDSPVRYLLRGADRTKIFGSTYWPVLENFLIKVLYFFPHAIDYVCLITAWRQLKSQDITLDKWRLAINERLKHHLDMGHDQEISWLIFLSLCCCIQIDDTVAKDLLQYPNAVCALQAFHIRRNKLLNQKLAIDYWREHAKPEYFDTEWWIFAYEIFRKNWLGGQQIWSHIDPNNAFKKMKEAGVTFYESTKPVKELIGFAEDAPAINITTSEYDEFEAENDEFEPF